MRGHDPGDTLAHHLDPRAKLAVQIAFAAAAFAHTTPRGLAALSVVTGAVLLSGRVSPVSVIRDYRFLLPFLAAAVAVEAVTWGAPWLRPGEAVGPLLAGYRVLLIVAVADVYVRTTPARASQAAVQWVVPGRPGRLLGAGIGLVFRVLPLLRRDLRTVRDASAARLGDQRPTSERMRVMATAGVNRAFARTDRLTMALQARCFSWNPTLPRLRLGWQDLPALALAAGLAAAAVA